MERAFRSGRAQLIVVYGRRRLGKTTLVREFIKGKKGLYLFTPRGSIVNILDNYSREVRSQLGSWVSFSSWFDFLDFLDATSRERFVVVMDEFQWLGESQA
ncbi:MAG: AAA family ATPase, partial [Candidatus Freyarchaeota archaeon]